MKIVFEVRRVRPSATQGEAHVYMNGHFVTNFGDDIQLIKDGEPFYGEKIGGWASTKPDIAFIRGTLCHPYEKVYDYHRRLHNVLDEIAKEEGIDGV